MTKLHLSFLFTTRPPPTSTLFPYTTLFRSARYPTIVFRSASVTPRAGKLLLAGGVTLDRKSTRLNSSHTVISYAVFCLKKKKNKKNRSYFVSYLNIIYMNG